jgi:hypothetical protein
MNLYPHDYSYLFTEYGRRKSQECYEIEMKERRLDDGEQEGNEYIPGTAPDTKCRRVV